MKRLTKHTSSKITLSLILAGVFLLLLAGFSYSSNLLEFFQLKPDTANTGISKEVATQIARKTFKVVAPGSTPSDVRLAHSLPHQNDVWQVDFGADGQVQVDVKTGKPLFVISEKAFRAMVANANNESFISEDQAKAAALDYASKMSLGLDGVLSSAELVKNKGGTEGANVWDLKWQRVLQGYRFKDDWVVVGINAHNKDLMVYHDNFFSNAPNTLSVNVGKEEALERVRAIATQEGFNLNRDATLMIVNPNYRWTDHMIESPNPDTRLAWVVSFDKLEGRGEIYVDAENGGMLGGDETK